MGPIGGRDRRSLVADINVTPLVDVMLVLLIIFMVTAPMMTQGVDVDLPETTAKALPQKEDPVVITIEKDGNVHLNKIKVDEKLLRQQLLTLAETQKDKTILLRADRETLYGLVVRVMAVIKDAGFDNVGMVTQPEEQ